MSIRQRISDANIILTNSLNLLNTRIGDLTTLDTTAQNTVVGAINELVGILNNIDLDLIDDVSAAGDKVYSSLRTEQIISTEIAAALTAALEGQDLSDLADSITALAQADNGLVSATAVQNFPEPQQATGRNNIGAASNAGLTTEVSDRQTADQSIIDSIGDTNFDFAAEINAILTV